MQLPHIAGYRLEIVEVPAPKGRDQIIREVLGAAPVSPPPGPPTRMLRITIEGASFPLGETPFEVRIGDQVLQSLAITGPGTGATGLLQRPPREGEEIALHVHSPGVAEPQVLIAGRFDPAILDDATA